ncbi:MAG: efflux RND transporter periplasmic adaptor subunit [Kiritimatiellaeota bacterium]|nr:efflux RND transporter periplasmic adaptor subunit [Kiritimatiellota bacterium]
MTYFLDRKRNCSDSLSRDDTTPRCRRWRGAALVALLLVWAVGCRRAATTDTGPETFTVPRGDLLITVTESGTVEAAESVSIKNEVKRNMRILEMVEEGTTITPEDVKNGKVLVRLDSNELEEEYANRQNNFESAKASLTQAKEGLAIQQSENDSLIRTAELNYTFALNDLKKLVGDKLSMRYADKVPENITPLLDDPDLGGQALQDLRSRQSNIELDKAQLSRARTKLEWTEKLLGKGYVTKNDRDGDAFEVRRYELKLEEAQSDLDLYRRYEFVKVFQKTWSSVLDTREKLERAKAMARSKLAQAQAQYNSRMATFKYEESRLERLKRDIEHCTIRAPRPGLVVLQQPPRWQNSGPLKVGSDVKPNQVIFRFPDISHMVVKVNIHESQIDLIELGQKAMIKIDAVPGRSFQGKVAKKAILPSSQNSWLNPDLKLYAVEVSIDGENKILRPGMTATVEIQIEKLADVLYVPIQAVQTDPRGKHYCNRVGGGRVPVEIGKRNEVFVVVEKGLAKGSKILMSPPELGQ